MWRIGMRGGKLSRLNSYHSLDFFWVWAMKAIAWAYSLLFGLTFTSSGALALSCASSFDIPTAASPPEYKQQFDVQTRQKFGWAEIVAEAKVIGLGETANMQWTSSQLVEVAVTRYLRAPLIKQAHNRYHITAAPDSLKVNDNVLFFASAEAEKTWKARLVSLNTDVVQLNFGIPATWIQRVWYAQGACSNSVYQIAAPENTYLVRFARQLADDKLAPSSLRLSFSLAGAAAKESSAIEVKIVGAKTDRTVRVTTEGTHLDLHAGRYRLLWPELPGYRPTCFTDHEKRRCEVDLVAGGSVSEYMEYQPTAKITVVPVVAGIPIRLLGELEWQSVNAPDSNLAEPQQTAFQDTYVRADELDKLDGRDGRPIVPGRYQLNWVVKTYKPVLTQFDACELLDTKKIALRWRIGSGELALEHDIAAGQSVAVAEIPDAQTVNLEFTYEQENRGDISVKPRCADIFSVSVSGDSLLKAVAFRGQQYELEYGCYGCKPRQEDIRKLMQADQDLVLELK